MHALSARDARERRETQVFQKDPQRDRRLHDARPRHRGIGIEVEDDQIRTIEAIGARAPDVELEHPDLHQRDERREVVHHRIGLLAAAHAHARDRLRDAPVRVLLVEARALDALRAAEQRERPIREAREHAFGHRLVVGGELAFRDTDIGEVDAVGVRER